MSKLPEPLKRYIKPSSVVAIPLQYDTYLASFDDSYLDFIDWYYVYSEDRDNELIYELQLICDAKYASTFKADRRTRIPERTHITAMSDRASESALSTGHVLILSFDASSNITGFAVIRELNKTDTFLLLFCSNVKGEAQKIMAKVEELARKEKHKRITADAMNESLVKYYGQFGFVEKEPSDDYRENYIYDIYIEKQLGGRSRVLRLTKRRKVLSRRRRLHK